MKTFYVLLSMYFMAVGSIYCDNVPRSLHDLIATRIAQDKLVWTGLVSGVFEKQQNYLDDKQLNGKGEFNCVFDNLGTCFSFVFRVEGNPFKRTVHARYDNHVQYCGSANTTRINDGFLPFDPFGILVLPNSSHRKSEGYGELWLKAINRIRVVEETGDAVIFDTTLADGFIRYEVESRGDFAGRIRRISWHVGEADAGDMGLLQSHEYEYADPGFIPTQLSYRQFNWYPMPDGTVKSVMAISYKVSILRIDPSVMPDDLCGCRIH